MIAIRNLASLSSLLNICSIISCQLWTSTGIASLADLNPRKLNPGIASRCDALTFSRVSHTDLATIFEYVLKNGPTQTV